MCGVGSRPTREAGRRRQKDASTPPAMVSPASCGGSDGSGAGAGSGRSSRRGRDASHLLNFQPTPHRQEEAELPPPPRRVARPTSSRQKQEDRVQFLRAKFHLFVATGADYRANRLDPDFPINWDCIRAVRFVTSDPIRCPICLLEPPLAPQIYACGHVLCLPCALRFHNSCEATGVVPRCPLCAENVSLRDLRSVCLVPVAPVRATTHPVAFSKLATTSSHELSSSANVAPCIETALASGAKLLGFTEVRSFQSLAESELAQIAAAQTDAAHLAADLNAANGALDVSDMVPPAAGNRVRSAAEVLRGEIVGATPPTSEPSVALGAASADCAEELAFLQMAAELVRTRAAEWAATDQERTGAATSLPPSPILRAADDPSANERVSGGERLSGGEQTGSGERVSGGAVADAGEETRLVLQAVDGQLVFADALSTRLLLEEFGSWGACPEVISAPIVELASHRLCEEGTRKRFKSVSHLPTSCTFQVAELDLSGLVSPAVLQSSAEQLARRAERRSQRIKQEARAEAAQLEKEREARRHGRSALALELEMISLDEVEAARRRQQLAAEAIQVQVGSEWEAQWQQQQQSIAARKVPSFAQMALKGFAATGPALSSSPEVGPSCSPLTPSPTGPMPCGARWARAGGSQPMPMLPPAAGSSGGGGGGGMSLLRPGESASELDAEGAEEDAPPPPLSEAWASSSVLLQGAEASSASAATGKKKGRKQQVTLLSNSGGRR